MWRLWTYSTDQMDSTTHMAMKNRKSGFTILEMIVVIVVGAILATIATRSFSGVSGRFAVQGAQRAFQSMHARARAQAIEYGTNVSVSIDPAGDSLWLTQDTTVLEKVYLNQEFGVDVTTSTASTITICMSPRGFGDTNCTSYSSTVLIGFVLGSDIEELYALPYGQLMER